MDLINKNAFLVRELLKANKKLQVGNEGILKEVDALKKKLNESIAGDFFQRKVSDVNSVVEHVILSLQKNGRLTSKHQCMTIHNYLLCKIWEDILYASVSESGFALPSIYLYIDMDSAGNDWTDVDKIISFLKTMRAELLIQPTYADFVVNLSNAESNFLALEI